MSATDQPLGGSEPFGGLPLGLDDSRPAAIEMFLPREGTVTWTAPYSGWWRFVQWGCGVKGASGPGGGSGAYCESVVALNKGQTVTIKVGTSSSVDTVVTLPNGRVITAGGSPGQAGGVATGGDYMLNGSAGGATNSDPGAAGLGTGGGPGSAATGITGGGAGAPGRLPFKGGLGGSPGDGGTQAFPGAGGTNGSGEKGAGCVLAILQPNSRV